MSTNSKKTSSGWKLTWRETATPLTSGIGTAMLIVTTPSGDRRKVQLPPNSMRQESKAIEQIVNETGCTAQVEDLKELIRAAVETGPTRVVRTTWKSGNYGGLFVMPSATIKLTPKAAKTIVFDPLRAASNPALEAVGQRLGKFSSWKKNVAPLIGYSTVGITCVGAALAAPLIDIAKMPEAWANNITGLSSGGKTTMQLAVMSVQGLSSPRAMIPPTLTERACAEIGCGFNHLMCPIDDLAKVPKNRTRDVARWLTYQFADGGGRLVADHVIKSGMPFEHYRSIGLLSSELDSVAIAKLSGQELQRGEQARMFDLRIDPTVGVFDLVPEDEARPREQIAADLAEAARTYCGTLLPRFLRKVGQSDPDTLAARVERLIDKFVAANASGADNVQQRAARKFGLEYAALELARGWQLLPWSKKAISGAVARAYRGAMFDVTHIATEEQLIDRLRLLLGQPGRLLKADEQGIAAGNCQEEWIAIDGCIYKGVPTLGIREKAIRNCFPNEAEAARLFVALRGRGWLEADRGKKAWQPRLTVNGEQLKPRLLRCSPNLRG